MNGFNMNSFNMSNSEPEYNRPKGSKMVYGKDYFDDRPESGFGGRKY
jgi:hypothetical protein